MYTCLTHLMVVENMYSLFHFRKFVAERIEILQQQNPTHNTHPETKIVHSIQRKVKEHGAMITKADKGNTKVILPTHQYETKLQDFYAKMTSAQRPLTPPKHS